mgnify:CR=1 FL=1
MKRFDLVGVDVTGSPVKLNKDVSRFVGHNDYFSIQPSYDRSFITLVTPKGSYFLKKSESANRYQGKCEGRKVHIILKKIIGQLIYW